MKTRKWSPEALAKREEGCRRCGTSVNVELDHHSGRVNDRPRTPGSKTVWVEPEDIWPLCGPFPEGCHGAKHRHEFDCWPLMHDDERERAIEIHGTESLARRHLGEQLMSHLQASTEERVA